MANIDHQSVKADNFVILMVIGILAVIVVVGIGYLQDKNPIMKYTKDEVSKWACTRYNLSYQSGMDTIITCQQIIVNNSNGTIGIPITIVPNWTGIYSDYDKYRKAEVKKNGTNPSST